MRLPLTQTQWGEAGVCWYCWERMEVQAPHVISTNTPGDSLQTSRGESSGPLLDPPWYHLRGVEAPPYSVRMEILVPTQPLSVWVGVALQKREVWKQREWCLKLFIFVLLVCSFLGLLVWKSRLFIFLSELLAVSGCCFCSKSRIIWGKKKAQRTHTMLFFPSQSP